MEKKTEDSAEGDLYVPEVEAYCFEGRKTELARAFGIANDLSVREVEGYLNSYRVSLRMLEMNSYEQEFFAYRPEPAHVPEESEAYLRGKMYEIRAFILGMPECDEKLLLYYHYVHGENLMRCAELLRVSRATVYRLKKRALEAAARHLNRTRQKAL